MYSTLQEIKSLIKFGMIARRIPILRCLTLLLVLMVVSQANAENNTVSVNDINTHINNSITTPIIILNATGISGGGVRLSYNASVVNITDAVRGDFTDFFAFDDRDAKYGMVTINTFKIGTDRSRF